MFSGSIETSKNQKARQNRRRSVTQNKNRWHRCTNGKGTCSSVIYLREEKLSDAFADALKQIQLTPEAVELTRVALLDSAKLEREFHEQATKNLNQELAKLQSRIERCYVDHVDGKISTDEWESRTALWKAEQTDLRLKLMATTAPT